FHFPPTFVPILVRALQLQPRPRRHHGVSTEAPSSASPAKGENLLSMARSLRSRMTQITTLSSYLSVFPFPRDGDSYDTRPSGPHAPPFIPAAPTYLHHVR